VNSTSPDRAWKGGTSCSFADGKIERAISSPWPRRGARSSIRRSRHENDERMANRHANRVIRDVNRRFLGRPSRRITPAIIASRADSASRKSPRSRRVSQSVSKVERSGEIADRPSHALIAARTSDNNVRSSFLVAASASRD